MSNVSIPSESLRPDLCVTTAHSPSPEMMACAGHYAAELHATILPRRGVSMGQLFAANPTVGRILVVQANRILLVERTGEALFYHPNTGFLRMGNVMRGDRDLLLDAVQVSPGDSVLDATLGYAAEAILCAHVVGDSGEVQGIEAVPEVGIMVREGLQTVVTDRPLLNEAMRRIRVVHLGHHLPFLRACADRRYDVVCFDPFFDEVLPNSEPFSTLRTFGDHSPLLAEAIHEARRVARRRVVVKALRRSSLLDTLGITDAVTSRSSKVVYGVLSAY